MSERGVSGGRVRHNKMKIAILTSGILPVPAVQGGAVEMLTDHLLEYNDRLRLHDITVYSVWHTDVERHPALQSEANHYRYINTTSLWARVRKRLHALTHRHTHYHYSISYYLHQALSMMQGEDYDCVLLENRPGYALDLPMADKPKLVYHLHNDTLNNMARQGREIYNRAAKIITVSDYIRSRVATCANHDDKTVAVHNGIDLTPFATTPTVTRQQLGYSDEDFILLFSGRLVPEKGILEVIEAMRMLSDEPQIKLMVMGSSFYGNAIKDDPFISELKSRAEGLEDRIRFTGYVQHELMADYLRLADVAVIPSTWNDPFPTTVLEGMAAGLPIVTTDRGGIPEMVTPQNAIVLPFPGDLTGGLARAIRHLYQHRDECRSMGEVSKQLSQQYTKEIYARNFFEVLNSIA